MRHKRSRRLLMDLRPGVFYDAYDWGLWEVRGSAENGGNGPAWALDTLFPHSCMIRSWRY